ncbi:MAG: superoxide dismutase [Desulfomonilaceae bacterium]|nr:superoxide dismutase [Desulfomonilaceae bacterium]
MAITLPELPYKKDILEPHISGRTLAFHYGKHHNAYVTNVNKLLEGTDLADETLENIIKKTANRSDQTGIFNNAAQVWNHAFYWQSMKPGGGGAPSGAAAKKIISDLGSYDMFAQKFKDAALTQFGSGWAWLLMKNGTLEVMKTSNADTPIARGLKPLLTVDVWEHAYYLDYQNRRGDYIDSFVQNLINWDFVNFNLLSAT